MDRVIDRLRSDEEGTLLVSEVAEVLNCSRSYVYKLIYSKTLTAGKVGSDYRIPLQEARKLATQAGILCE